MLNVNIIKKEITMKITLEDINAEQLLAIATALNNGVAPVAQSVTQDDIINEPTEDTIDFDKEGLPWDERIHSSNHKLTANGVWTRRRGVSDDVYESVKAELLGKWGCVEDNTPHLETTVLAPEAPVATPVFVPVQQEVAPVVAPTPVAPTPVAPAPVAPAPVAPAAMPAHSVFDTFSSKLQYALANKLIEANYMQGLLNGVNAAFGTAYKGMFEMRDNDNAMQFVINELAKKGI